MDLPDMGDLNEQIDKRTEAQRTGWWRALSSEERLAWGAIFAAAAVGPLGMSILAALGNLYSDKVPSSSQFQAAILLAVLTAPIFFGLATLIALANRGALAFMWAGAAAVGGGWVTSSLGPATKLGDFYCYRSLDTLEHACRAFDQAGFQLAAASAGGGPSGGAHILGFAFMFTADARGFLMTVCGAVAGLAAGYLVLRKSQES